MKLITLAALLAAGPAMAQVYKCPDAGGRTVLQQMPCAGGAKVDVRPASGHAPAPEAPAPQAAAPADAAPAPTAERPMTEAERINARSEASRLERRKRELENRGVPDADAAIAATQRDCAAQLSRIDADRSGARNNLAGATYLQSLSTQQQAIATRCDSEQRLRRDTYDRLLRECKQLGGCAKWSP